MKGILRKTETGWVVNYPEKKTIPGNPKSLGSYKRASLRSEIPIHPYYEKYYFLDEDAEGAYVEFQIEDFWETGLEEVIKVAKLMRPGTWYLDKVEPTGKGVDLAKLEKKLDAILETETAESFHEWLESKRGDVVDELPTTTSDLIDGALWPLPFEERMKAWDLIEKLVEEEKENMYTEEQIKKAWYTLEQFDSFEDFLKKVKQPKQ